VQLRFGGFTVADVMCLGYADFSFRVSAGAALIDPRLLCDPRCASVFLIHMICAIRVCPFDPHDLRDPRLSF